MRSYAQALEEYRETEFIPKGQPELVEQHGEFQNVALRRHPRNPNLELEPHAP